MPLPEWHFEALKSTGCLQTRLATTLSPNPWTEPALGAMQRLETVHSPKPRRHNRAEGIRKSQGRAGAALTALGALSAPPIPVPGQPGHTMGMFSLLVPQFTPDTAPESPQLPGPGGTWAGRAPGAPSPGMLPPALNADFPGSVTPTLQTLRAGGQAHTSCSSSGLFSARICGFGTKTRAPPAPLAPPSPGRRQQSPAGLEAEESPWKRAGDRSTGSM